MIKIAATTAAVGFVSAFVPAVPIEPYLVGAVALTGHSALVAGLAAGVGQSAGKTLMFLGARGVVRWPLLRRWIERRKGGSPTGDGAPDAAVTGAPLAGGSAAAPVRVQPPRRAARVRAALRRWGELLVAALRRPLLSVPILLLSAVLGFPPLLVVTFYAAGTPMPTWVFSAVCLVGRSIRFTAVAAAPHLFT